MITDHGLRRSLLVNGSRTRAALAASSLIGVVSAIWPGGIRGLDVVVSPAAGLWLGLTGALTMSPLVVLGFTLLLVGGDRDRGLDRDYHLSHYPSGRKVVEDAVASLLLTMSTWVVAALAGSIAGTGDWLRRAISGEAADAVALPSIPWGLLASSACVWAASCALVVACRLSGRAAGGVALALVASFWLLLRVTVDLPGRSLLLLHPLAPWWALAFGGRPRYRLDIGHAASAALLVAWMGVLAVCAIRGWRRRLG
ncbi:MAG: hypothetical protein U0Q21_01330 [Dermatophilaceae bacterium]